jgi:hypothetical protein
MYRFSQGWKRDDQHGQYDSPIIRDFGRRKEILWLLVFSRENSSVDTEGIEMIITAVMVTH